jgi:hypothetical protein
VFLPSTTPSARAPQGTAAAWARRRRISLSSATTSVIAGRDAESGYGQDLPHLLHVGGCAGPREGRVQEVARPTAPGARRVQRVPHRLSTITNADVISVIRTARSIIEQGSAPATDRKQRTAPTTSPSARSRIHEIFVLCVVLCHS